MSHFPMNVPLPDQVAVPMETLCLVVAAGEDAIYAMRASGFADEAEDLDEALGRLSRAILYAIGFLDDEE